MRLQEAVDAGGHEGPSLVQRERVTHAGGVAADQVQLKLLELVWRDDHGSELAEAGVDAIDCAALGHDAIHHGPVLDHEGQGALVQGDALPTRDARQQRRGEGASIKVDHRGSLREMVRATSRARPRVSPANE